MCRKITILVCAIVIALVLACGIWFLVSAQETYITYLPLVFSGTGKAAEVTGRIVDENGLPITYGVVRLAEVVCDSSGCAFYLDLAFSPGSFIDSQGRFHIYDVPPARYVTCVGLGDTLHWQIIATPKLRPIVWNIYPGEWLNLKTLRVWRGGLIYAPDLMIAESELWLE